MLHMSWGKATLAVWLIAQTAAMAGRGETVLTIDGRDSHVVILVGKTGLLKFAGHTHEVEAPGVRGRVKFDPTDWPNASVWLEFDAAALRVTGAGESVSDVPTVQQTMLGAQVLDVKRFPKVTFQSRRISAALRSPHEATLTIEGDLTLHGKTRPMTVRAEATADASGRVTATGTFTLNQTDFGMVPVTAGGGSVRVKDTLDIRFVLKASPATGKTSPVDAR